MTSELETKRLILRLPRQEDFDAFAELWADEEMLKDLPFGPFTRAECWPRFLKLAGSWPILGFGNWLVFEKTGAFVGVVGFFDAFRGLGPDFDVHRELGYTLSPAYSGKGYTTEACLAALNWMDIQPFGTHTVCMMSRGHVASIRVAEKCGYTFLREAEDDQGEIRLMIREKR